MKKLFVGFFVLAFVWTNGQVQTGFIVLDTLVDFGTTDENTPVVRDIRVYASDDFDIVVESVDAFALYQDSAFTSLNTPVVINSGDTGVLSLEFLPQQNINYESAMVLRTAEGGFGHGVVRVKGTGTFSKTYYASTQNQIEGSLRNSLSSLISAGYTSLGYTNARDSMYAWIDNQNGMVECVYTGRQATFNTRAGANANSFNTEHTFPQGFFSQNEPMRSDIHHLFPTDVSSNSQRGNDPFGTVNNASWSQGGSKSGGGRFEPRDAQKGASARAMMYFVLRYQDYSNFFQGHQNILYQWNLEYLPSAQERQRNTDIMRVQNNRNPFVDYPQLKNRMGSLVGNASLSPVRELYLSEEDSIWIRPYVQDTAQHNFIVYNQGNRDLKIFNIALSDTSMVFGQVLPDTLVLSPNQAKEMAILYPPTGNRLPISGFLNFATDLTGQSNIAIPIIQVGGIGLDEERISTQAVYPNPADYYFQFEVPIDIEGSIKLIDVLGRTWRADKIDNTRFDVSQFPAGLYFLQGSQGASPLKIRIK